MKNPQRQVYLALSQIALPSRDPVHFPGDAGPLCLCAFCKYATWSGDGCTDSWLTCDHPLADRVGAFEEAYAWESGVDCWGFQPTHPVDVIADYLGQRLQGQVVTLPPAPPN